MEAWDFYINIGWYSEHKATGKDLVSDCRRAKEKKQQFKHTDLYFHLKWVKYHPFSLLDPKKISGLLGPDQSYISSLV